MVDITVRTGRCHGAEDQDGNGICEGPDVRGVRAASPEGVRFETEWCEECRRTAELDGYVLVEVAGDCLAAGGAQ